MIREASEKGVRLCLQLNVMPTKQKELLCHVPVPMLLSDTTTLETASTQLPLTDTANVAPSNELLATEVSRNKSDPKSDDDMHNDPLLSSTAANRPAALDEKGGSVHGREERVPVFASNGDKPPDSKSFDPEMLAPASKAKCFGGSSPPLATEKAASQKTIGGVADAATTHFDPPEAADSSFSCDSTDSVTGSLCKAKVAHRAGASNPFEDAVEGSVATAEDKTMALLPPVDDAGPVQPTPPLPSSTNKKRKGAAQQRSGTKAVRFSLGGHGFAPNEASRESIAAYQPAPLTQEATGELPIDQAEKPPCCLSSLVLDGSWSDLVARLASGSVLEKLAPQTLDGLRASIRSTHQRAFCPVESEAAGNPNAPKREQANAKLKDRVLKLYSNAMRAAEQARALEEYRRIQIKIRKLEDIVVADNVDTPGSQMKAVVSIVTDSGTDPLPPLPSIPFNDTVMIYNSSSPYQVNYNPLCTPGRLVSIALHLVDNGQSTFLGEIAVQLSDLHQDCSVGGPWKTFEFSAAPGSRLLYGRVKLSARQLPASKDYVETKRVKALKRLRTVTEWIPQIAEDVQAWNDCFNESFTPLSADICLGSNLSLLHAAVFLRDATSVERLVELGACPVGESADGSALSLAQNMHGCCKESGTAKDALGSIVEMLRKQGSLLCPQESPPGVETTQTRAVTNLVTVDQRLPTPSGTQADAPSSPARKTPLAFDFSRCGDGGSGPVEGDCSTSEKELLRPLKDESKLTEEDPPIRDEDKSTIGVKSHASFPNGPTAPDLAASQNGTAMAYETSLQEDLPILESRNWLVPRDRLKHTCWHWERRQSCPHDVNNNCQFIHRQRAWGPILESIWLQMHGHKLPMSPFELSRGVLTKRCVVRGKEWWTAGYQQLNRHSKGQKVLYAEGRGPSSEARVSSQGISWYPSSEDACAALERVIIVSSFAAERRITTAGTLAATIEIGHSHYGPAANASLGPTDIGGEYYGPAFVAAAPGESSRVQPPLENTGHYGHYGPQPSHPARFLEHTSFAEGYRPPADPESFSHVPQHGYSLPPTVKPAGILKPSSVAASNGPNAMTTPTTVSTATAKPNSVLKRFSADTKISNAACQPQRKRANKVKTMEAPSFVDGDNHL